MCVWIRRIISSSPISRLHASCEEPLDECPQDAGHGISYDGLVDHLASKHGDSLMELRMPCAYVGRERLAALVAGEAFPFLEDLEVCVRASSLVSRSWDIISENASLISVYWFRKRRGIISRAILDYGACD